jgi:tRNA threonylcarbamoyladenosine biosynthesis protein TsaB
MRILAFDTSTDWLTVAVGDGSTWDGHAERAAQANSERILPTIDAMLDRAGWRLADLDGIAFGAGPGAFTGVRIACGVAQGLAFGAQLRVVAVPTLLALAQQGWRERGERRVFACLDARMQEVYVAFYERNGDGWRTIREPSVVKPSDVEVPDGRWDGRGDGFAAYPEVASRSGVDRVDAAAIPHARDIGDLAIPIFERGEGVPADEALPLYVRHRVALTTSEREAGAKF